MKRKTTKKIISLSLDIELLKEIDTKRKISNRTAYIEDLIRKALALEY